jgi:hypothetical protein
MSRGITILVACLVVLTAVYFALIAFTLLGNSEYEKAASYFQLVATIVGALAIIWEIRRSRREVTVNDMSIHKEFYDRWEKLQNETSDHEKFVKTLTRVSSTEGDENLRILEANSVILTNNLELTEQCLMVANFFELLGATVLNEAVNKRLARDLWKELTVIHWKNMRVFVLTYRYHRKKKHPDIDIYMLFEKLAEEFSKKGVLSSVWSKFKG